MSGNRFNRMPLANMVTNAKQDVQIKMLYQDLNRLAASVEREFLKMSHKIGEEDSISVTDQLAWFMSAS